MILREGDTVWRTANATRATVLFDGAGYFGALRSALLKARRSIFIAGWDIDSRAMIVGPHGPDDGDGAPARLRELLEYLLDRRDDLVIRLLLWDYSIVYALEREPLPSLRLRWRTPARVHVVLDDALPLGSSHHQKLVVIDDAVAFCGGLDVTINRWDTAEHRPSHPDRVDPAGTAYGPYHDLQWVVEGPVAGYLGELARERWRRACGERLDGVDASGTAWPDGLPADFENPVVGIARTLPEHEGQAAVTEVRDLYLESIREANEYIYIENQYLTADEIADAMAERIRAAPSLEVVAVTPEKPQGWLETKTMGVGQAKFMARLADGDIRERFAFYYPYRSEDDREAPVMVHSKLMIVDDKLLRLGSANLNRRSLGLDTECDLAVEADDEAGQQRIRALLCKVLAHQLGCDPNDVDQRRRDGESLREILSALSTAEHGLRHVEGVDDYADALADTLNLVADREQPIRPESFVGDMFAALPSREKIKRILRLAGAGAAILGLVLIWNYSPLAAWTNPTALADLMANLRNSGATFFVLLAAFVVGGLVLFPVTVLITVTGVLLDPWSALLCATSGALASAALGYWLGKLAGSDLLRQLIGRRLRSISRALDSQGVLAVAAVRMLPVAPYTVVNLAFGAIGIGLRDYLIGTLVGLGPGIVTLTIVGDRMLEVFRDPEPTNLALLSLAIALWIGLAVGLQRLASRMKRSSR